MNSMTATQLQQLFESGVALHQSGRLADAEARYRQVLQINPEHAEALHLLGVLAGQVGRPDAAVGLIERSLAIAPGNTEARFNLANALSAQRRFAEAIAHYQQVLERQPNFVEAMISLGHARHALGDRNIAMDIWQEALKRSPGNSLLLFHLATAKYEAGDIPQAIALLQSASRQSNASPEVFNSLGVMLGEIGRTGEAIDALRKAIEMRPDYPEALSNLGDSLREAGQEQEAERRLSAALRLRPQWPLALGNLASLQRQRGQTDQAIETYRRALAAAPNDPALWNNLGITLREKLDIDGAIDAHRRAIVLRPEFAEAHYALAWSLLLSGDLENGWKEFEWRLRMKRRAPSSISSPRWDGRVAKDRTVLFYAEQGFGDTIQFLRYIPLLRERVGRVIVAVQRELVSLLKDMDVIGLDESIPAHDFSFPLMSLGSLFGARGMTTPYIRVADRERSGPIRAGVTWAGRSTYTNDRNRSIPISMLEPLRPIGVELHSLQADADAPNWMIEHRSQLTDFRATAELIATYDLVISVDTAVTHLAGAMGKLTWILLPFSPDWRWMLKREDSPWYPTARLFRQSSPGDWPGVIDRVARDLTQFAQLPRPASDRSTS
jgi:tetratricopeptide (TPR) repeat protein